MLTSKTTMSYNLQGRKAKADIDISASGDNTIVAAPGAGKFIVIDFLTVFPAAAVTVQFKDGSTNFGGSFPLDAKQPITVENASGVRPALELSNNSAFVINLSGAVAVTGWVNYRVIGDE